MIKHIWTVLCQNSVVDSQSNNISLINAIEKLEVTIAPIENMDTTLSKEINLPLQYELVNMWTKTEKDSEACETKIEIIDPNGKEIKRFTQDLVIPAEKKRMRQIIKIQGITLGESGIYSFLISLKQDDKSGFEVVAEVPLEVVIK